MGRRTEGGECGMTDDERRTLAEAHVGTAIRMARRLATDRPHLAGELGSEAMGCLWLAGVARAADGIGTFSTFLYVWVRKARDWMFGGDASAVVSARCEALPDTREAESAARSALRDRAARARS